MTVGVVAIVVGALAGAGVVLRSIRVLHRAELYVVGFVVATSLVILYDAPEVWPKNARIDQERVSEFREIAALCNDLPICFRAGSAAVGEALRARS